MATDQEQTEQPPESGDLETSQPKPRKIHWRSGLIILILGAMAEAIVLSLYADDETLRIYITLKFVFPIVAGCFLLWWFIRSGFSWRIRIGGGLIALLSVVCFNLQYRIDGFSGAMWPLISKRSTPTTEERVAEYLQRVSHEQRRPSDESTTDESAPLEITTSDWPKFRGPEGDGIVRGESVRTNWDEKPPQAIWRHPIGPAWSSFAIVGELLFTQEQRGEQETVVCYGAQSGKQIWLHTDEARYSTVMGGTGPRATPTVFDSRVYALGATGVLNCLDARTGNLDWQTNILEDAGSPDNPVTNLDWGMSGSPLVYDDVVVVNPGGPQGKAIIVYDRRTGQQIRSGGNKRASYAGVRRETIHGEEQLLLFDAAGMAGYDPSNAEELWRFPWTNSDRINVAQPIVREESLILISSGYGIGSALLEPQRDASGKWSVKPRWNKPAHFKLKFNDGIFSDGYVYGLDEGILACIEFETGKMMWKRGRYGHGQLLLIEEDNLLLIQAEDGNVVLLPASPQKPQELARFQALNGKTWNHPVIHNGRLYVRNAEEAACYDVRP